MNPMELINMLMGSSNPQQMIQQKFANNPQIGQAIGQMRNMAGGKSPREFAMQLAKQGKGDVQQITSILDKFGIK